MKLKFRYDLSLVELVRTIPGRKWNPDDKTWTVPDTQLTYEILKNTCFGPQTFEVIPPRFIPQNKDYNTLIPPYAHQRRITSTILGGKAAIFAESGTGKTKCIVDMIAQNPQQRVLVACPAPLIGVWVSEAEKHGLKLHAAIGPKRTYSDQTAVSYDTLKIDVQNTKSSYHQQPRNELGQIYWNVLICDESQLLKNSASKRHRSIQKIVSDKKIIMTGTPYGNAWSDVWAQLRISFPEIGTMTHFHEYFCTYGRFNEITGYKNLDVLQRIIDRCAIAVRKQDCLDLPAKQYQTVLLSMSGEQKTAYKRAFQGAVEQKALPNILTKINAMRQISSGFCYDSGKSFACPKEDYLQSIAWDTPTIVWVNFKEETSKISSILSGLKVSFAIADGENPAAEAVDRFNTGAADVLIANLQSVQYGFTCNRATRVIYYSPSFSQMQRSQSEDRCHRIGQTQHVLYIDLISSTIEKHIRDAVKKHVDVKDYILAQLSPEAIFDSAIVK